MLEETSFPELSTLYQPRGCWLRGVVDARLSSQPTPPKLYKTKLLATTLDSEVRRHAELRSMTKETPRNLVKREENIIFFKLFVDLESSRLVFRNNK